MKPTIENLKQIFLEINPMAKEWLKDGSTDLFLIGVIDSLIILELIAKLEMSFDIKFNFEDLKSENFRDLNSLQKLLTENYSLKL